MAGQHESTDLPASASLTGSAAMDGVPAHWQSAEALDTTDAAGAGGGSGLASGVAHEISGPLNRNVQGASKPLRSSIDGISEISSTRNCGSPLLAEHRMTNSTDCAEADALSNAFTDV